MNSMRSMAQDIEPFPMTSSSHFFITRERSAEQYSLPTVPRARRRSSGLPSGELRGDTGAAALSTLRDGASDASLHPTNWLHRTPSEKSRPQSKRRKAKTLFRRWKSLSLRHTWVNPMVLCLVLLAVYAVNPNPSNPLHHAIFLSYRKPQHGGAHTSTPPQYGKGAYDFAFVAFYTVVLSFTREFLMQRLIRPIAIRAGIKSRAKQSRFMEQFYTAMYFGVFGPYGLYVMSRSPVWYFKTEAMFEGFPHTTHEGLFKAYYLLQASYWSQQAIVLLLQLEKPRKDFKELVGHHMITLALIWLSYRFHFTYMGLAVYITHDISDFFFATTKVLGYIESPFLDSYFSFFVLIWAYCRHYLNLRILYATLTTFRTVGPFELNWETQQYKCWISQYITFALLACLQSLNIFWLVLILRVAYRHVIAKQELEDVRSDYGSDDEDTGSNAMKLGKVEESQATFNSRPTVLLNGRPVEEAVLAEDANCVQNGTVQGVKRLRRK